MTRSGARLLVVSHPCVVTVNQAIYAELLDRGWDLRLVVPRVWRSDFSGRMLAPVALPPLASRLIPRRIALPGRPGRHFYVAPLGPLIDRLRPEVAFVEEETFAVAAFQWGRALARKNVPFGVQADENLDRSLPRPLPALRARVLRDASFVAARSPTAARLVGRWGALGEVGLVPHTIPAWDPLPSRRDGRFTIGYAGRLVEEKGIGDLLEAVRRLQRPVRLLFVGDGQLRSALANAAIPDAEIEIASDVPHDRMPEAYARMDVLVLPSRTTARWAEQFGRVLVEALLCEVPVLGSDSGEIPWVVTTTGGGYVFPEGDAGALAGHLARLADVPAERKVLAVRGRAAAVAMFGVAGAADALEGLLTRALER